MRKHQRYGLGLILFLILFILTFAQQQMQEQKATPPTGLIVKDNSESSEIQAQSSITSVTIYPDRASVIREADLKLKPGVQQVIFSGLPSTLIPNSLRASGKGVAAVKILGLEVASQYLESALLPEIKKLQAEIDSLLIDITKTKNGIEILDSQEKFLASIQSATAANASEQIALGRPDIQSWEKVFDFLGSKFQSLKQAKLDLQKILKEREVKLDALKKKFDSLKPQKPQEGRKVTVLLETSQAGEFRLVLSYAVTNARWVPLYMMRALPDSSEIELTLSGIIQQRSGENWEKVKAQLSTSSPALETQPSELNPWVLDIYVPRPASREKKAEGVVGGVLGGVVDKEMLALAPAPMMKEAELDTAAIMETGIHLNFEIKRSVDIPSDGAPHKVPIDAQKIKVKYDYVAIPKSKEAAFLRCSMKNTLAYPLLPGSADLFIIQDFVGTTRLSHIAANEEARMYFGEDGQIKVAYEQVKREKVGAGFLGKTEKLRLVYRITVQNLRQNTAEVEILDQLPVSQNSKIEVKDLNITPQPSPKDEKGILTWNLTLNPQEKKEILIDFTIEYPKDATIRGL